MSIFVIDDALTNNLTEFGESLDFKDSMLKAMAEINEAASEVAPVWSGWISGEKGHSNFVEGNLDMGMVTVTSIYSGMDNPDKWDEWDGLDYALWAEEKSSGKHFVSNTVASAAEEWNEELLLIIAEPLVEKLK